MDKIKAQLLMFLMLCLAAPAAAIKHEFLAVNNGDNRLHYVNEFDPSKNWAVSIPAESRQIQLVSNDSVLVGHGNGCAIYEKKTGAKLKTICSSMTGIQCAVRRDNGKYLLCQAAGQFFELDQSGSQVNTFSISNVSQLRLFRILSNGNLLFTTTEAGRICETDPSGNKVWQAVLPGKGYLALRLPNGNTMATSFTAKKIVEVNQAGTIVWQAGACDGKNTNAGLCSFSGFDTLRNGNVVVANWQGDGFSQKHTEPHVIELTRNNDIVWTWKDSTLQYITNVLILDTSKTGNTTSIRNHSERGRWAAPKSEVNRSISLGFSNPSQNFSAYYGLSGRKVATSAGGKAASGFRINKAHRKKN